MLKSNRMQVSLIFLTNEFSISAFGKENLKPVYHFLSKKKSWKMSAARKCRGGSNESMLLHKGWRVGLEHGRDVAPLALTTQGTRVGSARCTAFGFVGMRPALLLCEPPLTVASVQESVLPLSWCRTRRSPQHSCNHVQAEACLPTCISTDLIRGLGFHGRKHPDNSSGSSHYFCWFSQSKHKSYPFPLSFCIG